MIQIKNIVFLLKLAMGILLISFFSSCHKELDVENKNNPDFEEAFSDPNDVYNIAGDGFFR